MAGIDRCAGKAGDPGRSVSDNCLFVNGCLWVLRSARTGATCRSAMVAGRRCTSVSADGAHAGVWERVFTALTEDRDNRYLMLDSTIVRAHQQAATGKGGLGSGVGAFPRRTDKQDPHACRYARPADTRHPDRGPNGRYHDSSGPPRWVVRRARRQGLRQQRLASGRCRHGRYRIIPSNRTRRIAIPHDEAIYKHRNRIERCFNRLKHFRRFATRYDRRAIHFLAFIQLAATMIWLR